MPVQGQVHLDTNILQQLARDLQVDLVVIHGQDARAAQAFQPYLQSGLGGASCCQSPCGARPGTGPGRAGARMQEPHQLVQEHGGVDGLEQHRGKVSLLRTCSDLLSAQAGHEQALWRALQRHVTQPQPGFQPVHARHPQVQHHHIEGLLPLIGLGHCRQRGLRVVQGLDLKAQALQHLGQCLAGVGVVIHHQHPLPRHPRAGRKQRRGAVAAAQTGGEPEGRALAQAAVHPHGAAHQLRQLACDGQTQTGAAVAAAGGAVGLPEALEQMADLLLRQADARVTHGKPQGHVVLILVRQGDQNLDLSLVGELDRVVAVVDQHLAQAQRITHHQVGHVGRHVEDQLQALGRHLLRQQIGQVVQHRCDREVDVLQGQLVGLDLGEVQDVVDDAQQVVRGLLDLLQVVRLALVLRAAQGQVRHADDGVHGRADLMAHVGQEVALHARGVLGTVLGVAQFGLARLQQGVGLRQISGALHHPLFERVVQGAVGLLGPLALGDVTQDHGQQVFAFNAHTRNGGLGGKLLARGAQTEDQGLPAHHPRGLARLGKALHHLHVRGAEPLRQQHVEIAPHHVGLPMTKHAGASGVDHAHPKGRVHGDDAVHGGVNHGAVARRAGLQFLLGLLNAGRHLVEVTRQFGHFSRPLLRHRLADRAAGRKLHARLLQT